MTAADASLLLDDEALDEALEFATEPVRAMDPALDPDVLLASLLIRTETLSWYTDDAGEGIVGGG